MSRIGKLPIKIPVDVDITWKESDLIVKGKFGILQNTIPEILQINKTESCDKEQLGLFASQIRSWRLPEPYKGKGIIYEGEIIKRKAGKSGKK